MKKLLALFLSAILLVSCGSLQTYDLGELLPPLMDVTTQYPYVEKITIRNAEGETIEYTDGVEHDLIRMRFEGITCIREDTEGEAPMYEITFHTTDGDTTISILNEYYFMIGEYRYNAVGSGIDLMYFAGLFA